MNIGTIVQAETLNVRMKNSRGGRPLGEIEEDFAATLVPGDTFLIGGQTVRFESIREMTLQVTKQPSKQPKIAVFGGLRMATSLELSKRLLGMLNDKEQWKGLPDHTRRWLEMQEKISRMPRPDHLLTETFRRGERAYLSLYSFAGRNANQTLGLLLSRRMEIAGYGPLGFVASDYAVLVWSLEIVSDVQSLISGTGLRDGLDTWLSENSVMRRTFRNSAIVAGLIERNLPGKRKTGRQATFSSDILYDTLRKYDPEHLLMRITRREAMRGLVDFERIEDMLSRSKGIDRVDAPHVTPFAAPLLLEVGRVPIKAGGEETLIEDEAERLLQEARLSEAG
jgi:ATP-dependent Lhr-like helicase